MQDCGDCFVGKYTLLAMTIIKCIMPKYATFQLLFNIEDVV